MHSRQVNAWSVVLAGFMGVSITSASFAQADWPAEPRDQAKPLFTTGKNNLTGQNNWSGAHWNPQTKTLWICRNNHEFRVYRLDGENWVLQERFKFKDMDFEAITQTGLSGADAFLLAENNEQILQYEINGAEAIPRQEWNIANLVPEDDNGMEGMAFIPNEFLVKGGFVDGEGKPYPGSESKHGGLFLLSYQETGALYAVDLPHGSDPVKIGVYQTPLKSTRGLEFDRSTGLLHIVDGHGYATLRLSSSDGKLDVVRHTGHPGSKGLEGIALPPADSGETWVILTDDDNDEDRAVVLYQKFKH